MKFTVVTLFPQMIEAFLASGLLGQARERGEVEVQTLNPRDFTTDVHRTVDDRAFGGGDGMVMKPEPLKALMDQLRSQGPCRVALLSPQGSVWTQNRARDMAKSGEHVVLICGRYAGIDQRLHAFVDDEISLGDFVLNGGEVAACAVIESVGRLRPGVLGNAKSALLDSFSESSAGDALECPQFTRPREWEGLPVPAPLLSGDHKRIEEFVQAVSHVRTALLRPDLLRLMPNRSLVNAAAVVLIQGLSDLELRSLGINREALDELGGKEF